MSAASCTSEAVVALEKERARQLQVHPNQGWVGYQHGAEGGDRLVDQAVAAGSLSLTRRLS